MNYLTKARQHHTAAIIAHLASFSDVLLGHRPVPEKDKTSTYTVFPRESRGDWFMRTPLWKAWRRAAARHFTDGDPLGRAVLFGGAWLAPKTLVPYYKRAPRLTATVIAAYLKAFE